MRCHMPGHKGTLIAKEIAKDITEIDGADSLYSAGGIIAESERIAAGLFASGATLFSCGGATLANQTMLALIGKNRRVLASRYAHVSLISTAVLLGLQVDWLYPDTFLCADIAPRSVKEAVKYAGNYDAVFMNSLDYYGGFCDVEAVCETLDNVKVPLLCDNAHGAYLVFTDRHPMRRGAAMCADSAHKTLPALTGTAYLNLARESPFSASEARCKMSLFGSTSPSYLMLDSLDLLNAHIANEKDRAQNAFAAVAELKQRLQNHGFSLKQSDLLHVTIAAKDYGYSGLELFGELKSAGITAEYADENYLVLIFSTIATADFCGEVCRRLTLIKRKKTLPIVSYPHIYPEKRLTPREAYFAEKTDVPLKNARGRIVAGITAPCPPGIPLVMPGEALRDEEIALLSQFSVENITVVR